MSVRFEIRPSPRPRHRDPATGVVKQVEYVEIHSGRDGTDVVHRPATDADRVAFRAEYFAFNPKAGELPLFASTSAGLEEVRAEIIETVKAHAEEGDAEKPSRAGLFSRAKK